MRKLRSMIYVALVATAGLLAAAISPLMVLLASISMIAFLSIARQMNFYRIVLMMKSWAKNISRVRFEIRAKLHTGFRDYSDPMDAEGSHRSGRCSYAR
ncbi:MAG: hypothetical protein ABSF44_07080 [Candidatus Bathyarchaeia archaeon]